MRRLSFFLALLMAVGCFCLSGCDRDKKKEAPEREQLVVGFDAAFPPYGFKDEKGKYVGFDLELAKEVADRNGWEFKAKPIDWNSKDAELSAGTIDCIWNGFTMNGRENEYTWSNPYVNNTQVIVVKASSSIEKAADLKGKTVAVQDDSSAQAVLENEEKELTKTFADGNFVTRADYLTALTELRAGSLDAVVMDSGVAQYQLKKINKDGKEELKILSEELASEQYGVGFKKGNTALRDKVQKTLDEMMKDGTFKKISDKWGLSDSAIISK